MEKIPRVNEHDEVIGVTTIKEAKEKDYYRRLSRVFVFDEAGRMLLQKRSRHMDTYPLTWDQAVGGHVNYGESYKEAAVREMKEELGIDAEVSEIATSFANNVTFNGVFKTVIPAETPIDFDPHEVEEVKWISVEAFENAVAQDPGQYARGFIVVWQRFRDKLIA